jgi:hypothetical protein
MSKLCILINSKAKPHDFQNKLILSFDNMILVIPDVAGEDQFSTLKFKYLFVEAMPVN